MPTKNQFVVEIEGIPSFRATKVDGLDVLDHTPSELPRGNQPNDELGPGKYKVGEVKVTVAEADVEIKLAVSAWHRNYVKRTDVTKRGARVIVMDDAGVTPLTTYELHRNTPTKFAGDGLDAGSSEPAYFSFAFRPEDYDVF